jgi:hypothetical protein
MKDPRESEKSDVLAGRVNHSLFLLATYMEYEGSIRLVSKKMKKIIAHFHFL